MSYDNQSHAGVRFGLMPLSRAEDTRNKKSPFEEEGIRFKKSPFSEEGIRFKKSSKESTIKHK